MTFTESVLGMLS